MSNSPQRSFAGGEIAPALHARADLARYAIGLRTCRNMVVMRAGGATKRPGTQFVHTAGVSSAYTLTLTPFVTVVAPLNVGIVAVLRDWLGTPVTAFPCTFETDSGAIATVAATGPRSANVHGVANGTTKVRARIAALGLVSNDCDVTVTDYYVLHAFVGDGTFNVTAVSADGLTDRLIVGGGGSGGSVDGSGVGGGGGGAGELIYETAQAVTVGAYPITIGGGGIAPHADHTIGSGVFGAVIGNTGSGSTAFGRTARGGGGGGAADATLLRNGRPGGSGGGGASAGDISPPGGAFAGGPSTAVAPGVGHAGGDGINSGSIGAGGGGAGGAGSLGTSGVGLAVSITGASVTYAVGGTSGVAFLDGAANTGNGGSGGGPGLGKDGGNGGSGIVYVRYKASSGIVATGGIVTTFPL